MYWQYLHPLATALRAGQLNELIYEFMIAQYFYESTVGKLFLRFQFFPMQNVERNAAKTSAWNLKALLRNAMQTSKQLRVRISCNI